MTADSFQQLSEISKRLLLAGSKLTEAQYLQGLAEARIIVGDDTKYLETVHKYRPRSRG